MIRMLDQLLYKMICDNGWWTGIVHDPYIPVFFRASSLKDLQKYQSVFGGTIRQDPDQSTGKNKKAYEIYIWKPDDKDLLDFLFLFYKKLLRYDPYERKNYVLVSLNIMKRGK